jgi:hypothetical protein
MADATQYRVTHLKKGGKLNVRDRPIVNSKTWVGKIPWYGTGIKIKECKYNSVGQEWCYISYPMGARHLEGWVNRRYLVPMSGDITSRAYIKTFLRNFYEAEEEDFLDKLKVFYHFPMQQYRYWKNVNYTQLRTKKVALYKQWSRRNYKMTYLKILKRRSNYIDVQTSVRWKFRKYDNYESGRDIEKLRLILDENNQFKVLAMKRLSRSIDPKPIEVPQAVEGNETIAQSSIATTNKEKQFYIKIGSFLSIPSSEYLLNIKMYGFNYTIEEYAQGAEIIKRVYIGPYTTMEEAQEALKKVKTTINQSAYIRSF